MEREWRHCTAQPAPSATSLAVVKELKKMQTCSVHVQGLHCAINMYRLYNGKDEAQTVTIHGWMWPKFDFDMTWKYRGSISKSYVQVVKKEISFKNFNGQASNGFVKGGFPFRILF